MLCTRVLKRFCSTAAKIDRTTAPRKGHELSIEALSAFLAENVDPAPDLTSLKVEQFTHGQSNPTYLLTAACGERMVLRKQPNGKILRGAHDVLREARVMNALWGVVPVPRVRAVCDDRSVLGTDFFVYEFVPGRLFTDRSLLADKSVSVEERRGVYGLVADSLARIHCVDVGAVGLEDFGADPSKFLSRQVRVWTSQWEKSGTAEDPESVRADFARLSEVLGRSAGPIEDGRCGCPPVLFHGDARLDNMVLSSDGRSTAAVLDWELSTLGHPLLDVAHCALPWRLPELPAASPISGHPSEAYGKGVPSEEEFVEDYYEALSRHGCGAGVACEWRDDGLPSGFDFFSALSCLRAASILQGVYARSLAGNASATTAREVGKLAALFASMGREMAERHVEKDESRPSRRPIVPATPKESDSECAYPAGDYEIAGVTGLGAQITAKVREFLEEEILPVESRVLDKAYGGSWEHDSEMSRLKELAKKEGLWNLFLTKEMETERWKGPGLTLPEYAHVAEVTGRSLLAPAVFNCAAPDTGNMEVLLTCGSDEQQSQWLEPLLRGEIRSAFCMTEPDVASSDPTQLQCRATGKSVLHISGTKWWASGAMDPDCKLLLVVVRDSLPSSASSRHTNHSILLVPIDAPGVTIRRPLSVLGYTDAPHGHAEIAFDDVQVEADASVVLGRGRGFEIAQRRLGPGRVHHCMRLVGAAQRSIDLARERAQQRSPFGKPLSERDSIRRDLAQMQAKCDMARLLVLHAATKIAKNGGRASRKEIAAIKAVVPTQVCEIIDNAMQIHGAKGLSQDTPLAHLYAGARALRIADGPDEVHWETFYRLQ